jgi:subtilase family serine protease
VSRNLQVRVVLAFAVIATTFGLNLSLSAPSRAAMPANVGSRPNVQAVINDAITVPLTRDLPGALRTSVDEGKLSDSAAVAHVRLALTRPAPLQAALDRLTRDQHVRGTANFRHWLAPSDLRAYGPAQADVDRVAGWLTSHGLTVNGVSPSGMSIDFSGSSGKIAAAFHTQLHYVLRSGEAHIANVTAPAIPAALAPVVSGVMLSNFFPKPAMRRITPNFTINSSPPYYAVAPADFAKIYNINPLRSTANFYGRTITGDGVTIAVVEQTLIRSADWDSFRAAFKLSGYSGTLTQIHPAGCASPGTTGDEGEAALDAEWSSAVAPKAKIIEASCAGLGPFGFGVLNTLQNLVEYGTPATIFSISYEGDEVADGFAFQSLWTNLLEEGAAEGKAIFVAAGDNGVSADRDVIDADGLFVNGLADSAYNVSVGGTDFYDTALNENSTYWQPRNSTADGSALSYVPEIPWNNSCASSILWSYLKFSGPLAFCNSSSTAAVQNGVGGSGSQSQYYTKPDWQLTSVLGVPNDGVRDQPDVSLFAANGIWSHFYVFCMSDAGEGGAPCNYTNVNDIFGNAAGGTSFGAPAFAGIAALLQETLQAPGTVAPLGNPAPVFYAIAKAQFTTPLGFSKCNATLGNKISSACVFNYVTAGDIAEPCLRGTSACVTGAESTHGIGVLRAQVGGKSEIAYPGQAGYSLATGLGTVNVTNLLYNYYPGL